MRNKKLPGWLSIGCLAFALSVLTGCQTWMGGMTLPSGHYLDHPPQYFAPDPPFPLERELQTMQEQGRQADKANRNVGNGRGVLPPPVPAPVPR
jgi:hypothetical protein